MSPTPTKNKNMVVYGIYPTRASVEKAVATLKQDGFRNTDVSVLFSENVGSKEFAHEKSSKAPEGTAVGAGAGVLLGGALGWLAGIGALAFPVIGPLVAAGPIVGLLAGAGVGGTLGGVAGGLLGLGIPEYEAKRFEGLIVKGGILLSVHCDDHDWTLKARKILEESGAKDISSTHQAKASTAVDQHNNLIDKAV